MTTAATTAATRAVSTGATPVTRPIGDTGEGDVAHPVADEREPALDEEDADHRGDGADEQRGDERPLHEVDGEQVDHGRLPSWRLTSSGPWASDGLRVPSSWSWWWLSWSWCTVLALRRHTRSRGAVEADAAAVDDDDAGQQPLERSELVGDDDHRHVALDEPLEDVGEDVLVGGVDARRWARP